MQAGWEVPPLKNPLSTLTQNWAKTLPFWISESTNSAETKMKSNENIDMQGSRCSRLGRTPFTKNCKLENLRESEMKKTVIVRVCRDDQTRYPLNSWLASLAGDSKWKIPGPCSSRNPKVIRGTCSKSFEMLHTHTHVRLLRIAYRIVKVERLTCKTAQ